MLSSSQAHDLPLPAWGPYSKRYAGVSHIPDPDSGLRFDLSVFPGFYRGRSDVPNVCWDSGYTPWRAAPDGSAWEFRHALTGDQLTVTVSYAADGPGRVRLRIACTNRGDAPETLSLHLVASCQYPAPNPSGHAPQELLVPAEVDAERWLDARDHAAHHPPVVGCLADGRAWRELRASGMVDGGGLRLRAGDRVRWPGEGPCWLRLRESGGTWQTVRIAEPVYAATTEVDLDGLAWGREPTFRDRVWRPAPALSAAPGSMALAYPDLGTTYHLAWSGLPGRVREWHCTALDVLFRHKAHDHVSSRFHGDGPGHWTDVVLEPLAVPAHGEVVLHAVVAIDGPAVPTAPDLSALRDGPDLGQQLIAATVLTNLVYPVYTHRGYVRHHSPGKAWDSLYTWDAGFVGLGLLELDVPRAYASLRQYLMAEDDPWRAWLHHGSPVPVQMHLAQQWWNRTRDLDGLRAVFPGLRRFHRFLVGRHPASDTAKQPSGLLQTWSLFYNSGGWDDYPAQSHVHRHGLAGRVTPAITSAFAIRSARILGHFAELLGEDGGEFAADAAHLERALQMHAWDDAEGWFSYVDHHEGRIAPLRDANGVNLNRGLDGLTPLVAGICTPEQRRRLIDHLDHGLWTAHGVTTVDTRAPYYSTDGYWNGTVWMAHQWFLWRALLDLGDAARAWRIAETALRVWRTEVEHSHRCFEHFPVVTGRGAGWHHFSSLSNPVLSWHAAHHAADRVTGGYECWIEAAAPGRARLRLTGARGATATVLVVASGVPTWNGSAVPAERQGSAWAVQLPAEGVGELAW